MPSAYRVLFAAPGSKGFSAAGFLGRMPLSMMGIGVVTMVSQLTGRYGLAGALSATIALAAAVAGPHVSRLVDRHRQRRVLRPATLISLTAAALLLFAAHHGWADWVLFVACAGIGCVPSVGAMIRARWAALYRGTPQLHTAYPFGAPTDSDVPPGPTVTDRPRGKGRPDGTPDGDIRPKPLVPFRRIA